MPNVGGWVQHGAMTAGAHDRSGLAAFQNGEKRLVYARYKDRPDAPLHFLEDGTASELRDWAKLHVECFMPECEDRALTTVSRTRRRDGFRHRSISGSHSKESLFHEQGKVLIARWARERYLEITAVVEQATEDRSRRADVMLIWPDGWQVAVEIQYAGLALNEWEARHDSYVQQGIPCIWLLGHVGKHLRPSTRGCDQGPDASIVRTTDLHREMSERGVPLLWLNPIDQLVGTVCTTATANTCVESCVVSDCRYEHDTRTFPAAPQDVREIAPYVEFTTDALADCILTRGGLITPSMAALTEGRPRIVAARAADAAAAAEHAERSRLRSMRRRAMTALQASRARRGMCPRCGQPRDEVDPLGPHWLCGSW